MFAALPSQERGGEFEFLHNSRPLIVRAVAFLVTLLSLAAPTLALPLYSLAKVDYLDSQPITNRNLYPTPYPSVEVPWAVPAVDWVFGQAAHKIQIAIQNPVATPHFAAITLSDFKFTNDLGQHTTLSGSQDIDVIYLPAYGASNVVEITLHNLPRKVLKGHLTFDVSCTSVHAVIGIDDLSTRLYLTVGPPKSIGLQNPAWIELLEFACGWAYQADSLEMCAEYVNHSLFRYVFDYEPHVAPQYLVEDISIDPVGRFYKLRKLLDDLGSAEGSRVVGDCRDMSYTLQVALSALGVEVDALHMQPVRPEGWQGAVLAMTNHICPAGKDPYNLANYEQFEFQFHQICHRASTGVMDPTTSRWVWWYGYYFKPTFQWSIQHAWQFDHRPEVDETGSWFYGLMRKYSFSTAPPQGEVVPYYPPEPLPLTELW